MINLFFSLDSNDSNRKNHPFSSSSIKDHLHPPLSHSSNRIKSTSESPFPRSFYKSGLKPSFLHQSSSRDLNSSEKKHAETPIQIKRTFSNSQKARNSSSLSPSTQIINIKDPNRFLNPIEEILPKGMMNLKKKKLQKNKPRIPLKPVEKLESGLIFIAKNMKMVEDRSKAKENLKRKEPVFMAQTQYIFKVFQKNFFFIFIKPFSMF